MLHDFLATIWICYNLKIQERMISVETIRGNEIHWTRFCYQVVYTFWLLFNSILFQNYVWWKLKITCHWMISCQMHLDALKWRMNELTSVQCNLDLVTPYLLKNFDLVGKSCRRPFNLDVENLSSWYQKNWWILQSLFFKGQIISEGNFGVLNLPKYQRNYCKDFCPNF